MTTETKTDPEAGQDEKPVAKNGAAVVEIDEDEGEEPSLEDLALESGWTPREKWKGDPANHVGPAEYLRRKAKSAENLARKLGDTERRLEDSQKEIDRRVKVIERSMTERQKMDLDDLRKQLRAKVNDAIESGDKDAIKEALKEQDEAVKDLEEAAPVEMTDEEWLDNWPGPAFKPLQEVFWNDHSWVLLEDDLEVFGSVEELIDSSVKAATGGKRAATARDYEEAFDTAERFLKRKFKDRYTAKTEDDGEDEEEEAAPVKKTEPKIAPGKRVPVLGGAGNRTSRNSLASKLPPEAIKEADACVKKGLFADREEWAKVYVDNGGELAS